MKRWPPVVRRVARPLERFFRLEASSGIVLLLSAALALTLANSRFSVSFKGLLDTPIFLPRTGFAHSPHWLVDDGLMTIFFFLVGLEIRREIHHGELSQWKRAALPIAGALGGMIVPALLFLSVNPFETRRGWGIPMATDIAFAVGVLTLLGKRVPPALRVLLLALAVIDDLGAILVIAFAYSSGIHFGSLPIAGLGVLMILLLQRMKVRAKLAYALPAFLVWLGVAKAGIHPTIAGVMVGLLTPVALPRRSGASADDANQADAEESPSGDLIHRLHPFVAFGVMPIFALVTAGVSLSAIPLAGAPLRVMVGVVLGLVIGKPLGVALACLVAVKAGLGVLPRGIGPREIGVLGAVAGIGFTMSFFVAQLAFADPVLLAAAKIGILVASATAAVLGLVLGRFVLKGPGPGAAADVEEAERSTEL